ncbi:MAG TPA: hypothetical protein VFX20_09500 [Steroidobacteraceae bacterium]|nr:hypothetical protein [Steroidobacteraceae bacterium]
MNTTITRRTAVNEHTYFLSAALVTAVIIFAGFARSYYLRVWFDTHALPALVHVHGVVMTAWIALFFIQALLIARHRTALHRRLGVLGTLLAALIVVIGMITLLEAATREVHADPQSPQATFFLMLLCFDTVNLLVFTTLITGAILLRKQGDWHKRLMLLATASLLGPALARLPLAFFNDNIHALFALDTCILLCAIVDSARYRRLHPVFAWGVPFVLGTLHVAYAVAVTPAWVRLARVLIA